MAIAAVSTVQIVTWAAAASYSGNLSCTGNDRLAVVSIFHSSSTEYVSGVTCGGTAMTKLLRKTDKDGNSVYFYYILNPTSGTNSIVISSSNSSVYMGAVAASYSGVAQTGFPDSQTSSIGTSSTVTSYSISTTTVADNCWLICCYRNTDGTMVASTNTYIRVSVGFAVIADTNSAQTPAGSKSLNWTSSPAGRLHGPILVSVAPALDATFTPKVISF